MIIYLLIFFLIIIFFAYYYSPIYLSSQQCMKILTNRKYLDSFTKKDLIVRNVKDVKTYINKNIPKSVTNFTFYEKIKLFLLVKYIHILLFFNSPNNLPYYNYYKFINIPWKFGRVTGKLYENGLPHTRKDIIILTKNNLKMPIKELCKLLVHEKTHIYQKLKPKYVENYLKYLKFVKLSKKTENIRANPDTDDYIYADSHGIILSANYKPKAVKITDVELIDNSQYYEHPYERMAMEFESFI